LKKGLHAIKKFGARQKSLCARHFPKPKSIPTSHFWESEGLAFCFEKSLHATKKFGAHQKKVFVRDIFQKPNLVQLLIFRKPEGLAFLF
jgi:hypothetical protein